MEASQASEAGSIPVARSTTAWLRAGRFCHASATGTPGLPHTLRQAQPVQNSPHSRPWQAIPVQNSPRSRQNAHCGPFSACRENFIPLPPPTGRAGRTLYRFHHPHDEQGELCTARGADAGTKLSPLAALAGRTGTKLSPHPQNGPFQHVLRQQGELCNAFTTHATSREKKVPHQHSTSPTNAPLPQFRMQFDCLNFQSYPETLQSQRYEFKI